MTDSKARKLTLDQTEYLDTLVSSDGYPVLLKVLEDLCSVIDKNVLSFDLNRGPDGLVIAKARSEGARSLQRELITWCEKFSKRGGKATRLTK